MGARSRPGRRRWCGASCRLGLPRQARLAHQALHGAAGHLVAGPVQLASDFAGPYTLKFSLCTRVVSAFSCSSRTARCEAGLFLKW